MVPCDSRTILCLVMQSFCLSVGALWRYSISIDAIHICSDYSVWKSESTQRIWPARCVGGQWTVRSCSSAPVLHAKKTKNPSSTSVFLWSYLEEERSILCGYKWIMNKVDWWLFCGNFDLPNITASVQLPISFSPCEITNLSNLTIFVLVPFLSHKCSSSPGFTWIMLLTLIWSYQLTVVAWWFVNFIFIWMKVFTCLKKQFNQWNQTLLTFKLIN